MSRILNRQRQLAEQGRLRLGLVVATANGRSRPKASTTWILTSHSREHIEKAASLWGGEVEEWQPQGNGAKQWRVITTSTEIDAILPPGDPLSQAYEMWNKGGCVRRCDGVTEQLSGSPCPCFAQFGDEWHEQKQGTVCDSKSRLKVLLPDMPGLGSWRVETGSYYATDEIAGMVDFIRASVGDSVMVPVKLRIEPRTRVAGGQTKQFTVPVLDLRGVTAGALVSGAYTDIKQVEGVRASGAPALEAAPAARVDWRAAVDAVPDLTALQGLWREAKAAGALSDELAEYLKSKAAELTPTPETAEEVDAEIDKESTWQQVLSVAGKAGVGLQQVIDDFTTWTKGVAPEDADGRTIAEYLDTLKAGA